MSSVSVCLRLCVDNLNCMRARTVYLACVMHYHYQGGRGALGVCVCGEGGVQLTPLSTSFCISKNIQKFISHQRASSSAGAAAWLKTMSFNVLKMSCKVLLPKVPLAYDPLHSNIKWHAWLFSWNKSFLVITVICGSRPYTPITPVWGISVSVSIWERERKKTIVAWNR